MIAIETDEVVDVLKKVSAWPATMRISLARRILETLELPEIAKPPKSKSLDQFIGILKTDDPPPTDAECDRILEEQRMRKYG